MCTSRISSTTHNVQKLKKKQLNIESFETHQKHSHQEYTKRLFCSFSLHFLFLIFLHFFLSKALYVRDGTVFCVLGFLFLFFLQFLALCFILWVHLVFFHFKRVKKVQEEKKNCIAGGCVHVYTRSVYMYFVNFQFFLLPSLFKRRKSFSSFIKHTQTCGKWWVRGEQSDAQKTSQ